MPFLEHRFRSASFQKDVTVAFIKNKYTMGLVWSVFYSFTMSVVTRTIKDYSESTTIHGIAYIFESSVTALERLSLWRD